MDNQVAIILDCANQIYKELGCGFSESVYHRCMEVEFRQRGITYENKSIIPVIYNGHCVGHGEADLIVFFPDGVNYVIELKAVCSEIHQAHLAQTRTYLRGRSDVQHGIVINFPQLSTASYSDPDKVQYQVVSRVQGDHQREEEYSNESKELPPP